MLFPTCLKAFPAHPLPTSSVLNSSEPAAFCYIKPFHILPYSFSPSKFGSMSRTLLQEPLKSSLKECHFSSVQVSQKFGMEESMEDLVSARRLQWLGRIARMDESRLHKHTHKHTHTHTHTHTLSLILTLTVCTIIFCFRREEDGKGRASSPCSAGLGSW